MSLKTFHIVFIIISILLCFGFGVWSLLELESGIISILSGVGSFAAGILLIAYAKRFLEKFKKVSYL